MATASDILKIAEAELGVKESPAGSNKVKYNTWYYGKAVSGASYPWCVAFIEWCFNQIGALSLLNGGKKTASCSTLAAYAKKNGLLVTDGYRTGDLVFMNFSGGTTTQHIGFVVSASGSTVNTIEGNTSSSTSGSQSNGGCVAKKSRSKSVIVGAYRPQYDGSTPSPAVKTVSVSCRQVKQGDCGNTVKALQILLNGLADAKLDTDGEFGAKTAAAVKKYQATNKSVCGSTDGIVGQKTWQSLLS